MPKLSVIIPVYNVEQYLDKCVLSVLKQTLEDIEIILVDDGSPDRCPQMCDEYARKDSRVRVIHKKNAGQGRARNSGLDIATGDYATFLDSDDYVDTNTYKTVCGIADEKGLDTLRFICNRFKDDGSHSPEIKDTSLTVCDSPQKIREYALSIFDPNRSSENPTGGSACMSVYKMSVIREYGLRFLSEREYLSEDYLFNFSFYQYAHAIGYLPNTFYHYRVNMESTSRKVRLDKMVMVDKYCRFVRQIISAFGYHEEALYYADSYFVGAARGMTLQVFRSRLPMTEKYKWFREEVSSPYFKEVFTRFCSNKLPLKQRIIFYTMKYHLFVSTYLFLVIYSKLRKDRFK